MVGFAYLIWAVWRRGPAVWRRPGRPFRMCSGYHGFLVSGPIFRALALR